MGALTYQPETDTGTPPDADCDLDWLAGQAARVERELPTAQIDVLRGAAGGSGGARPKVVCLLNPGTDQVLADSGQEPPPGFSRWLVKFRSQEDHKEIGREEYAYSLMARAAGVEMPRTRLIVTAKAAYFAVERFDRSPAGRRHVHTMGGLIGADHRMPSHDYRDLLKVTQALTQDASCLHQVIARAAFNVLARNRDDHVKNHAFLMDGAGRWRLSPAYDVTYSVGPGGEHNMTIAGEGKAPTLRHVETLASEFRLPKGEVAAVLEAVRAAVGDWPRFAAEAGLSGRRAKEIGNVLKESI
jgi:serine/threonine-protein kinase HipA